jgi:lipopolysaccharide export LptBFGC system permease protein LptF
LLWLVMTYPWLAALVVAVLVLLALWLLPKMFRFARRMFRAVLGSAESPPAR